MCLMAIHRSYFVKHLLKSCVLFIKLGYLGSFFNIYMLDTNILPDIYFANCSHNLLPAFSCYLKSFYIRIYEYFQYLSTKMTSWLF